MHHKQELQVLRQNLLNNLWQIINNEPVELIKFREFLVYLLVSNGYKITTIDGFFISSFAQELKEIYAEVLSTIKSEVVNGDLIGLEKYVRNNINGTITNTLTRFLSEYRKNYS